MALNVGDRLGHYDVMALVGEGGMGRVFRATDTQLGRDVALKILPDAFAADPDRLARFQRQAHVLASLNHPNIAQIHGIEKSDDTQALVLELVEGPTLADRIAKGPIPLDEALPIARQIAEALEAAHEAGVIHRDLKPANIKVRDDGTVKVLDFGLAKALDTTAAGDPSQSPTLTAAATQMGVIMGTAAYMSPEQASGSPVDRRADVWSFGVVLYEMLVGRRLFEGETVSHVLASVLKTEPDWTVLPSDTPALLRRLLRRCLSKDRKERLQHAGDARLEVAETQIAAATTDRHEATPATPLQVWQQPAPALIGVLIVAVITGLAGWSLSRPGVVPADVMRFVIPQPDTATFAFASPYRDLAISADGTQVVYRVRAPDGERQLYRRPIDRLDSAPLRGSEDSAAPFVSPDGEWVGFVGSGSPTLQKVSILGGPPVTLAAFPTSIAGASWGGDSDQIIVGMLRGGLFRVPAGGGEPEVLTTPDADQGEVGHYWPSVIQGREAVLFGIDVGQGRSELAVLALDTGEVTRLGLVGVSPHYASTGHLVYAVLDGSVRAVPFDVDRLEVTGNPVPLLENVLVKSTGAANFSLSDNGRLVFTSGAGGGGPQRSLVWVDRQGQEESLGEAWQPAQYVYPRVSPDGTRVAVAIVKNADTDLWVLDLARPGISTRITFGGSNGFYPVWSPDGLQLAYADGQGQTNRLLLAPADGDGQVETILDRNERQFPTSWESDGNVLAIHIGVSGRDLAMLPMDGDRTPVPLLVTPFDERAGAFSPDGHWLAYVSDESGQDEVYVRPVPGPGQQHTISTNGGVEPVWSPDGRELFYRNTDQVLVVAIDTAEPFRASAPELLFVGAYDLDASAGGGGVGVPNYDIAPDGRRFLMVKTADNAPQITVVLNWHQELVERVPIP